MIPDQPDDTGLWAEHADALQAFLAVQTQWHVVSLAQGGLMWVGLDYVGADTGLRRAGIELTPDQWSQVQMIETGALKALNRSRMQ